MYGMNIKTLNVYNGGEVIWTKSGNQGDAWHKAEVSIIGDFDVSVEEINFQFLWYSDRVE